MKIAVRKARAEDAYALWLWANDADTRAASFGRPPIAWEDHVRWLGERLRRSDHLILVAESETGQPLGTVRFDTGDDWRIARLSYALAPEARGRGRARPMLSAGLDELYRCRPGVVVHADVLRDNHRSMRLFTGFAWYCEEVDGEWVRFWSKRV
ncbi:MAG TPA: GNAT family N-acetyltransferase [Longimicrobiales bacterium]